MSSASWSHCGRILLNASRVYYLPDEPSLPPLRWMAEKQRFEYLSSANSEDVELRASITELAQACSQLYHLQSVQQQSIAASLSCYLPCEALYGVLPLGSVNSALIYVTEKEYVCTLSLGGATHEVYAVRGLQWLNLPGVTSTALSQRERRRRERRPRGRRGGGDGGGRSAASDGASERDAAADAADPRGGGKAKGNESRGSNVSESGADEEEGESSATDTDAEDAEDDAPEEVGRLPSKTVNDYLAVLHRFCESVNTQDGGQHAETRRAANAKGEAATASELPGIIGPAEKFSYLYYSSTLDLSADPVHLLGLITHTLHPSLALSPAGKGEVDDNSLSSTANHENGGSDMYSNLVDTTKVLWHGFNATGNHHAWEDLRAAATARQLYQWNGPLLSDGLALPSMAALRGEFYAGYRGGNTDVSEGAAEEAAALPWRGVCAEEVQRDARSGHHNHVDHHVNFNTTAATAAPTQSPSSVPLYLPSFIRGLVAQADASPTLAMTLLNCTCCRWAGTRYNRRGLEPGHSGVVANMSMTSLWVTPRSREAAVPAEEEKDSEASGPAAPFAVYTVMRGSVPRRWEQPANLSLKPTIKISPVGNAAEEFGRHIRLLKQCLPWMHTLFCLDTMSTSALEEPLAEGFAAAVRRYVEGTPKVTSPAASLMMDDKDATHLVAAAAAEENGGGVAVSANTPDSDPSVKLVKFNVKRELQTHDYDEMVRRCVAELDGAADADTWLDFTKGTARAFSDDEDDAEEDGGSAWPSDVPTVAPRLRFDHLQSRLVRVNCLDCLDRTNLVQSILLAAVLPRMMAYVNGGALKLNGTVSDSGKTGDGVDLCLHHPAYAAASHRLRMLMAAQGTAISQLYAGTEPHFVPYMLDGHHHWAHKAVEGVLAQRRWYQQNFFDGVKQDGISLVTRQHDPQVFNADIESPFSRDLSGMNRQVMYGLLLGILPFIYSVMMCFSEHHYASSVFQLHFAICLCWALYISILYSKLMRYRVTYTNRPLLLYTRQVEWC
ncbi:putative mitochondrial synaptojanin (N-terminal domain) [Leptomonas pyrrhocoris]|uniref:Putative mitochondrial synaptojanin (N-terminal domain) n=1 Tax=Leptomonas pyrrhocoris TaxID=157538 RepID=A0A0N0E0J3_LEPPY|nr:putative mitochondrial synaptojanin (N-terminal domain) [Leptomonas pyrrhocoris]KPA86515.1 putative mitochondrial synaptojanin (N-terminal domain) [Leptomonas pyrrhocoris]|eukprot:XP_015664954.1 putative mitochondrial synaptojanin (N-terminal domain) [Leptomonas pyrrhocoris]